MRAMRAWSVKNARPLALVYRVLEAGLKLAQPVLNWIGYRRVEKVIMPVERGVKRFLFDSKSCGQCVLGATGLSCPMNCPKSLRNGPCGGVRSDGGCEVDPEMQCVWVLAWEGSKRLGGRGDTIHQIQAPVDHRRWERSSWLRAARHDGKNQWVDGR